MIISNEKVGESLKVTNDICEIRNEPLLVEDGLGTTMVIMPVDMYDDIMLQVRELGKAYENEKSGAAYTTAFVCQKFGLDNKEKADASKSFRMKICLDESKIIREKSINLKKAYDVLDNIFFAQRLVKDAVGDDGTMTYITHDENAVFGKFSTCALYVTRVYDWIIRNCKKWVIVIEGADGTFEYDLLTNENNRRDILNQLKTNASY